MEFEVYTDIKQSVKDILGIDLNPYKDKQMRRRLDAWLVRRDAPDWDVYLDKLKEEPDECSLLRNYLTINVSSFFRDPERWRALEEIVLPLLLDDAEENRSLITGLRIWSAGCSIGAEPYTVAFLLGKLAPTRQHYILATDLDQGALIKARASGPYVEDDLRYIIVEDRRRYFEPEGPPYFVKKHYTKWIDFKEHNLLTEPFETDFDLIICRNVVIYFKSEVKDKLYRRFHSSLRSEGYLFLGGTEFLMRPQEMCFRHDGTSFYIKS